MCWLLIALFIQFQPLSFKQCLSFFLSILPVELELAFRHFCLLSIAGQCLCVFGHSICCVLGLSVTAGDTLRPGARPFSSHGQALLKAFRGEVVNHWVQAAVKAGQAQSDGVKSSGKALHTTVSQCLRPHQGIQEEDGVIRDEADDEDTQMDNNHS